jgi:hypothetical protein
MAVVAGNATTWSKAITLTPSSNFGIGFPP